jgi:phospholipase A1
MKRVRQLAFLTSLVAGNNALALGSTDYENCLLTLIADSTNAELRVQDLKGLCENTAEMLAVNEQSQHEASGVVAGPEPLQIPFGSFLGYFQPYKKNYFSFGSMKNQDGGDPFSGKTSDIQFQIGLKFALFEDSPLLDNLAPLYFGYSQKSWWDIAESSAPFKEHNYNPEVFWDFRETTATRYSLGDGIRRFVDVIGYEHQSNGLDQFGSRSWDRIYAQREFKLGEKLGVNIKAWNVVNLGEYNTDITDYLGNVELSTSYTLSDTVSASLTARQGHRTEKISYQLDLQTNWKWMNGQFFLSYYDGYGEALISYNEKTRSLRAGVHFPIANQPLQ